MPGSSLDIRTRLKAGQALVAENRLNEAEVAFQEVIAVDPGNPDAHNLLGLLAKRRGNLALATRYARQAIALDAHRPEFHSNLGNTLLALGDLAGASAAYGEAARLQPNSVEHIFNRGIVLNRMQQPAEAEVAFRQVLDLQPNFAQGWTALAGALLRLGQFTAAEEAANRAISIQDNFPEAWINLGRAWLEQGKLGAAEQANRRALQLDPRQAQAAYNLGYALQNQWRCSEAVVAYRQATSIDSGHHQAWSNQLMAALYDPDQTERSIHEASLRWTQQTVHRQPDMTFRSELPKSDGEDRRLRIGYVSPDFKNHSCASFLKPLFAEHDSSVVEVFAYAKVEKQDHVTEWFRKHVHHWRDIYAWTDEAAAKQIHGDRIDILVDLAGHTINSPIGIFRLKPAPIEVSWLGYPATTGVEQIDYRLTDALADPEGNADTCHVEKLFRLEGGFHCYSPRDDVPEVAALPAESNGFITFGSFNNLAKITLQAVEAWSQILQTNQGSRLILKSWMLNYAETRARITSAFALHGIELHRLSLQGWMPAGEYLNLYSQVDIGLDTFPYNGTTTTFESLYLGLPVITLRGERHAGRVGASILTHIGRTEWIADNIRDYVATAQKLANDVPKLAQERANLRQLLQQSSLCDEQGFARKIERAYRKMWREKINRTD